MWLVPVCMCKTMFSKRRLARKVFAKSITWNSEIVLGRYFCITSAVGAHHVLFAMENMGIVDYMANGMKMEWNIVSPAIVQPINSSSIENSQNVILVHQFLFRANFYCVLVKRHPLCRHVSGKIGSSDCFCATIDLLIYIPLFFFAVEIYK